MKKALMVYTALLTASSGWATDLSPTWKDDTAIVPYQKPYSPSQQWDSVSEGCDDERQEAVAKRAEEIRRRLEREDQEFWGQQRQEQLAHINNPLMTPEERSHQRSPHPVYQELEKTGVIQYVSQKAAFEERVKEEKAAKAAQQAREAEEKARAASQKSSSWTSSFKSWFSDYEIGITKTINYVGRIVEEGVKIIEEGAKKVKRWLWTA